jgi:hypothetical protein
VTLPKTGLSAPRTLGPLGTNAGMVVFHFE